MNKAYATMRQFWLDIKNLQHKEAVPHAGPLQICVAGVEMTAADEKGVLKHILIAASSLGNASIYFENNSPGGIGAMTGGSAGGPVRDKALQVLQAAAKQASFLQPTAALPEQTDPAYVNLFTVSANGQLRYIHVKEAEARQPENAWYEFFAYSQQLLGAFRSVQEQAAKAPQASRPPVSMTEKQTEPKA